MGGPNAFAGMDASIRAGNLFLNEYHVNDQAKGFGGMMVAERIGGFPIFLSFRVKRIVKRSAQSRTCCLERQGGQ